MRLIEVYQVSKVAATRPVYVKEALHFPQQKITLLEVNPSHPVVKGLRAEGISIWDDLRRRKFGGIRFIWQGRIQGEFEHSRFFDFAYYCPGCKAFHSVPDPGAFSQFLNYPAEEALTQMVLKFGVLDGEPHRSGDRKVSE